MQVVFLSHIHTIIVQFLGMKVRNAGRVSSLSHTKGTSKLPATVRDGKFQKRSTKGRLEDSIKELAMKGESDRVL